MVLQVCSWSTGLFIVLQVCLWSYRSVCGLTGLFMVLQVCSWSYRSVHGPTGLCMILQFCSSFVDGSTDLFMVLQICSWSYRSVRGLTGLSMVLQVWLRWNQLVRWLLWVDWNDLHTWLDQMLTTMAVDMYSVRDDDVCDWQAGAWPIPQTHLPVFSLPQQLEKSVHMVRPVNSRLIFSLTTCTADEH